MHLQNGGNYNRFIADIIWKNFPCLLGQQSARKYIQCARFIISKFFIAIKIRQWKKFQQKFDLSGNGKRLEICWYGKIQFSKSKQENVKNRIMKQKHKNLPIILISKSIFHNLSRKQLFQWNLEWGCIGWKYESDHYRNRKLHLIQRDIFTAEE